MHAWLLFFYKLPREPSTHRVYVWRKLKRLEAILLFEAAWVLPQTPDSQEQLERLRQEVIQLGGKSILLEVRFMTGQQEDMMYLLLADQGIANSNETQAGTP